MPIKAEYLDSNTTERIYCFYILALSITNSWHCCYFGGQEPTFCPNRKPKVVESYIRICFLGMCLGNAGQLRRYSPRCLLNQLPASIQRSHLQQMGLSLLMAKGWTSPCGPRVLKWQKSKVGAGSNDSTAFSTRGSRIATVGRSWLSFLMQLK